MGLRTSGDGEEDSDLLGRGVLHFLLAERGTVVPVLLEQLLHIFDRPIQFVLGERLSQLQLRGVDDLADARPVRVATDLDFAHKVVGGGDEFQAHPAVGGALGLHPDIHKPARGIECLDALADLVAIETLTDGLHDAGPHPFCVIGFECIGELDGFDLGPLVRRHAFLLEGGRRGGRRRRFLRGGRLPRRGGPGEPRRRQLGRQRQRRQSREQNPPQRCQRSPARMLVAQWFDEQVNVNVALRGRTRVQAGL